MKVFKVLLLYPPLQFLPQETPRPDGSLGLLYLAAALEKAGFCADVLDAAIGSSEMDIKKTFYNRLEQPNGLIRIGMSFEDIAEFVAKGGYNIVGISSNFTVQTSMALQTAKAIKRVSPEIRIIAGGVNARNMAGRFLDSNYVDAVGMTEGEKIFPKLIQHCSHNADFEGIDGIMYLRDGKYVFVPPKSDSIEKDLDKLPIPLWSKLPLEKYAQAAGPHGDVSSAHNRLYAPIMSSRGCPFKCAYCHISLEKEKKDCFGDIGSLRLKSVDRVLEEARILHRLGVKRLYFEDDSLLAKKKRVGAIFEGIRRLGLGFTIADVNGVNLIHLHTKDKRTGRLEVDRDYLQFLKDAGFDHIVFAVESGSQRILDKYASGKLQLGNVDLVKLIKIASKIGITCPINMMIGFPDETEPEIMQTVKLAKRLVDAGAYHCAFFIATPFPGSRLFNFAIANGYLDSNFDPAIFNVHRVAIKNTAVSPGRLAELKEWAWRTVNRKDYVEARLKLSIGSE